MNVNFELFKTICETPGASGFEKDIREVVKKELQNLKCDITTDNIGNLIVKKTGTSSQKKIMVTAHMDEIGFLVHHIDKDGFIFFLPLGGFDAKTLSSQRVLVHGNTSILGVMGTKPIHVLSDAEKKKLPKIEDYFIDVGMNAGSVKNLIPIGSPVTRKATLEELGDLYTCKSIDNRVSVYVLIEVLKNLKQLPYDFYGVFSTQEEVGLRGSKVASLNINPDFGINLDTGIANDIPKTEEKDRLGKLGEGPGIKMLDRSVICDTRMVKYLKDIAIKNKIPFQLDIKPFGGTDTASLQMDGRALSGAISIVTRYLHQTIETVSKSDIINSIKLLSNAIENLDSFSYEY